MEIAAENEVTPQATPLPVGKAKHKQGVGGPNITAEQLRHVNELEKRHVGLSEIIQRTGVGGQHVYKIRRMKQNGTYLAYANRILKTGVTLKKRDTSNKAGNTRGELPKFAPKLVEMWKAKARTQAIAQALGISVAMVYYWRKRIGTRARSASGKKSRKAVASAEKVLALRKEGHTLDVIAKKLRLSIGKVNYQIYKQDTRHTNGGGSVNGNHAIIHTGAGTANTITTAPPSRAELIGRAWGEASRLVANISERTQIPKDLLTRRLSELLAFETLR